MAKRRNGQVANQGASTLTASSLLPCSFMQTILDIDPFRNRRRNNAVVSQVQPEENATVGIGNGFRRLSTYRKISRMNKKPEPVPDTTNPFGDEVYYASRPYDLDENDVNIMVLPEMVEWNRLGFPTSLALQVLREQCKKTTSLEEFYQICRDSCIRLGLQGNLPQDRESLAANRRQ